MNNLTISNKNASALRLYLVTDALMCTKYGLIDTVLAAIKGGVTMVQLRDKHASDDQLYHIACTLKEAIAGQVPLLMNDKVQIAKKAGLDGAHIGQGDMPVTEARAILGDDAWLGLTINTPEQLRQAQSAYYSLIDYVGLGPVFSTQTKVNHAKPLGIVGLKQLVQQCHKTAMQFPSVAIGGIHQHNAHNVYQTGCDGIAVVSAICAADDPCMAAKQLLGSSTL